MKKFLIGFMTVLGLFGLIACASNKGKLTVSEYEVKEGEKVVLIPDNFITKETTYSTDQLTIESELKSDTDKYDYNEKTNTVTTKGKDYLEAGTYKVTISVKDGSGGCQTYVTVLPQ